MSGQYFVKSPPARSSSAALNRSEEQERLWAVSERMTGIGKS
jgi:hypothetical protein